MPASWNSSQVQSVSVQLDPGRFEDRGVAVHHHRVVAAGHVVRLAVRASRTATVHSRRFGSDVGEVVVDRRLVLRRCSRRAAAAVLRREQALALGGDVHDVVLLRRRRAASPPSSRTRPSSPSGNAVRLDRDTRFGLVERREQGFPRACWFTSPKYTSWSSTVSPPRVPRNDHVAAHPARRPAAPAPPPPSSPAAGTAIAAPARPFRMLRRESGPPAPVVTCPLLSTDCTDAPPCRSARPAAVEGSSVSDVSSKRFLSRRVPLDAPAVNVDSVRRQ